MIHDEKQEWTKIFALYHGAASGLPFCHGLNPAGN